MYGKNIIVVMMSISLSGCAIPTGYQPITEQNYYGYFDKRLGANEYYVIYRGSSSTKLSTVEKYWEYRVMEICGSNKYEVNNYKSGMLPANEMNLYPVYPGPFAASRIALIPYAKGNVTCKKNKNYSNN